jgi:hypothetical protein
MHKIYRKAEPLLIAAVVIGLYLLSMKVPANG